MTSKNFFVILSLTVLAAACGGGEGDGTPPPGLENADITRGSDPGLREYLNDPALTAVTRDHGFSAIPAGAVPSRSPQAQAATKPWSSWWYPKRETLTEAQTEGGLLSALAKYDRYRRLRYGSALASARDWEEQNTDRVPYAWEGLCDAWALAAISKPEPKRPVTLSVGGRQITFSVGDLKALLLKTYEAVNESELKYFGQKFTGNNTGWVYPDMFPEQFHRLMEVQLFEKREPLVMDHDAGTQIWNVPVYKANYNLEAVPGDPNAVFVRTWLYSAETSPSEQRNFVGTKEAVREYNYILKGTRDGAGNLIVNSGYWVVGPSGINSRTDHPDFMYRAQRPGQMARKSWNPQLDTAVVDEILLQSY